MLYIKFIPLLNETQPVISRITHQMRDALIMSAFGFKNANNYIKIAESGKPYIDNADFDFSVSHTNGAAAIAACGNGGEINDCVCINIPAKHIGVDIECADRTLNHNTISHISEKFFSKKELEYLKSVDDNENGRFLEIWTKKESIVKATGEGISALRLADTSDFPLAFISTKYIEYQGKTFIISVAAI